MEKRTIGSLEVSIVGLGGNNFGTDFFGKTSNQRTTTEIVHAALDTGINFIDTAEEYSVRSRAGTGCSEQYIGAALATRRDQCVLATKFQNTNLECPEERGAQRIVNAVDGSLRRLQTDYIDLLQQHQPDSETPMDEVLHALDRLIASGKVREIGCCNFSGPMIDEVVGIASAEGVHQFVSAQNRFNVLDPPRQEGVLEACSRQTLKLLPYYPLGAGLLTGKYRTTSDLPPGSRFAGDTPIARRMKEGLTGQRLRTIGRLNEFALDNGRSLLELAFSWLASQPIVGSVIAGATSGEQVLANAAAAAWQLSESDFEAVNRIVRDDVPKEAILRSE